MCYISDITLFLYQLAQAHPHNVIHFLVEVLLFLCEVVVKMKVCSKVCCIAPPTNMPQLSAVWGVHKSLFFVLL